MYVPFFGLRQAPFSIAPDPRFLYLSAMHREALAHLLYGLEAGGGFVLLSGDIGAGKTTVCRCFLEQVPAQHHLAYIFNPRLTVPELLQTVCQEFGIGMPAGAGSKPCIDALNAFMLHAHAEGRHCLLVIDEAQSLAPEVLEQLRLLTNLETNEKKLLQIVLIGQPELRSLLASPALEQLSQRVVARLHLGVLTAPETADYIRHRWSVAGSGAALPFDSRALGLIHRLSGGVPRRINLLCDRALLGAYSKQLSRVDGRLLRQAAREVFGAEEHGRRPAAATLWLGTGLAAAAAMAVVALMALLPGWPELPQRAGPATASASASAAGSGSGSDLGSAPASAKPMRHEAVAVVSNAAAAVASAASTSALASPSASAAMAIKAQPAHAPTAASAAAAGEAMAPLAGALPDSLPSSVPDNERVSEPAAWAALARQWQLELPAAAAPCVAARTLGLACHRGQADLGGLRRLDRPAILSLKASAERPAGHALLEALGEREATLRLASGPRHVTTESLARSWSGEFATLWRPPPGYREPMIDRAAGPAGEWLLTQLTRLQGEAPALAALPPDEALRRRVFAFQLQQGLRGDGLAGPLTLMHLNRAAGIAEPRLTAPR